ncbi:hypothetical protein HOP50_06g41950 [Chloropicon primus]|uniref:Cyclic nucleotide-binding domain-containing protein n=1 Tax=Chloropicon primus TaxID=1764295 RepID=A0A5B8MMP7_9CHLO|nr:hypothetical protein A3770_06p41850 [Chloropicon primus]UPR00878.1 hypothetical protein HOP50_06g41950 [Chloropicon primus]|eukprot:QDZ21667.1 hypothetical protein A3770_06p41850 [Chloropicon primus]
MGTESILLKLSHKRTEEELTKVKNFFHETEGLKQLCCTIPEAALDELCNHVKIEDYGPEELICREGDSGDKLHFILSGTATEYKSTGSIEKNLQRIDSGEGLSSMANFETSPASYKSSRPHTAGARLSTASRASVISHVSRASVISTPQHIHAPAEDDSYQGGGQSKFRGVRSIQMPFLRVNMAEKEESKEDLEQRALEEERLRALSGLYATSPPRSGGSGRGPSGASSPDHAKDRKKGGDSPPNQGQLRRASQMLRSRAMSRRESMSKSIRSQRKSRYVSKAFSPTSFGRASMINPGSYRSRKVTQTGPTLMEYGLKYGYLTTFDSFGELMIFHAEKHKLSVIAGQDGCLILTMDRGTISRTHNLLASEGRQFLTAIKLWASRRILNKPQLKRHDVDLNTCATLLSELDFLKNLKLQMRERICKQLTLQCFESNTIICKQGDTGNKIYGILMGKVSKHQKKITSGIEGGSELRKNLLNTSSLGQIGAGGKGVNLGKTVRITHLLNKFAMNTTSNLSANKFKQMMSSEYTLDPSKCRLQGNLLESVEKIFGSTQEELGHGGTIGNLALLKQNQSRHFTCLSTTFVETVSITYDDYNKCVTQFEEEAIKERVELLGKLALFKNLTKAELRRIIQMGKTVTFAKDQGIMKAEERGKGCYIILSGEASLIYGNAFMDSKLHPGLKVRPKSAVPSRKSNKDKSATSMINFDMLQVSLLGPGSYFGEEAMLDDQVFEYNVIATKKTEVLVLSLRELTFLSANSDGMVETWANKIREWRQERVNTLANTTMNYQNTKETRKGSSANSGNDENTMVNASSKQSAPLSTAGLTDVDMKRKLANQKLPKKQNQKNASSMMKGKDRSRRGLLWQRRPPSKTTLADRM